MDLEDEYAEDVEERIELEKMLAETKEQLTQQKEQLSLKDEQLSQKEEQLSQKDAMITTLVKSMLSDGKTIESISKDTEVYGERDFGIVG